jgi:putative membrane protein
MKQTLVVTSIVSMMIIACNSNSKDSVEKADSINNARQDSNTTTKMNADDESSSFLVRVANNGMAEAAVTKYASEHAAAKDVKDFAAKLHADHMKLNDEVKKLAGQKSIALPDSMTPEKRDDINTLEKKTGKDFDKDFLDMMVSGHEKSIDLFSDAVKDAKDSTVINFANNTLPTLRSHLESAKTLRKKY